MSENDKKLAHEIVRARAKDNCVNGLEDQIYAALTTVRKEAREAAFREMFKAVCPDCAEGDEPMFSQQARWYYHREGNQEVGCSASKLRIEAAANTEEGAGNTEQKR